MHDGDRHSISSAPIDPVGSDLLCESGGDILQGIGFLNRVFKGRSVDGDPPELSSNRCSRERHVVDMIRLADRHTALGRGRRGIGIRVDIRFDRGGQGTCKRVAVEMRSQGSRQFGQLDDRLSEGINAGANNERVFHSIDRERPGLTGRGLTKQRDQRAGLADVEGVAVGAKGQRPGIVQDRHAAKGDGGGRNRIDIDVDGGRRNDHRHGDCGRPGAQVGHEQAGAVGRGDQVNGRGRGLIDLRGKGAGDLLEGIHLNGIIFVTHNHLVVSPVNGERPRLAGNRRAAQGDAGGGDVDGGTVIVPGPVDDDDGGAVGHRGKVCGVRLVVVDLCGQGDGDLLDGPGRVADRDRVIRRDAFRRPQGQRPVLAGQRVAAEGGDAGYRCGIDINLETAVRERLEEQRETGGKGPAGDMGNDQRGAVNVGHVV